MKALLIVLALVFATPAFADYYATGKITGQESHWFGFGVKNVSVDAVKQEGRMFEVATRYAEVSSYSGGRCWIDMGWAMTAITYFHDITFYELKNGEYRKLNLSNISFSCVKR
jgi:hypothetical protein